MDAGGQRIEGVLPGGTRLDVALAAALEGVSRARVQALIGDGHVRINDSVARQPAVKIAPGTPFRVDLPTAVPLAAAPQPIALAIAYEDEHLVVVDKAAGMVVHPAAGNPDGTLVNALLYHCSQNPKNGTLSGIGGVARPGIVHRIDKDTSGLIVVAKSDAAHAGLARQFADHSIARAYLAVTIGVPSPTAGTVRGVIGRSDADRKKMAVLTGRAAETRGKHAVTHYRVVEPLAGAALVECRLETGRTHQVRVQLASIGHALLGDPVYARTPPPLRPLLAELGFRRQALHAAELGFGHPITGARLDFAAPLPADMRELIARLRAETSARGR